MSTPASQGPYHFKCIFILTIAGFLAGCISTPAERDPTAGLSAEQNYRASLQLLATRDDSTQGLAARHLQRAAEQGSPDAQYLLANVLRVDAGDGPRLSEAAVWYRRAAEQGHARAQNALADAYLNGIGVAVDTAQAAVWYRKAAEQDIAEAQFMLATLLLAGRGVAADRQEAWAWYGRAAALGHPQAPRYRQALGRQLFGTSRP